MPALDSCHQQIVNALRKAGWKIRDEPYYLLFEDFSVFPDIRASQTNGSIEEIVIVEVKCFLDEKSYLDELYRAIGQYLIYRNVLRLGGISAKLYLAIPHTVYDRIFLTKATAATISDVKIRLLLVDIDREEIVQWFD